MDLRAWYVEGRGNAPNAYSVSFVDKSNSISKNVCKHFYFKQKSVKEYGVMVKWKRVLNSPNLANVPKF